jgi:hypothetical protein
MLLSSSTPSLIGGVSQQPAALQLPGQCAVQENALGTVVEGLKKRPALVHQAVLGTPPDGTVTAHFINRDAAERYVVLLGDDSAQGGDNGLKVYDLDGDGTPIAIKNKYDDPADEADFDYLDCDDPATDLKFLTVHDYTFVLNAAITPAMGAATTADRNPEGLVTVRQGNYSTDYTVTVKKGATSYTFTKTTLASDATGAEDDIKTNDIAEDLETGLNALSGFSTAYDITREGSTLHIARDDGTDFELTADDSVGSTILTAAKGSVQAFGDLPTVAPDGFHIAIDGDPETDTGSYYVSFATTSGEDFGDGTWSEAADQGVAYQLDPDTLPHLLIRKSNGDFVFTPADGVHDLSHTWGERSVGDTDTNPDPSFVGEPIRNVFFFQDRLGFLAGEAVVLSESGQYFNFFRTSTINLLDAARIDVHAAHTKVSRLNHAVPLGEQLVLFSDQSQFVLRGEATLTPTTVSIAPTTEFENLAACPPQAVGRRIFFAADRGGSALIQELVDVSTNRPVFDAVEVTSQVPSYIPASPTSIASSPVEDVVAVLTSGETGSLFVYKYLVNGGERVQSAWSKFPLSGTGVEIVDAAFIRSDLYMVIKRGSEYSLELMSFEPNATDPDSDFEVALDRKISEADCSSVVYDSATDQTTFTIPYTVGSEVTTEVVTREGENLVPSDDAFTQWTLSSNSRKTDDGKAGPFGTGTAYYWHGAAAGENTFMAHDLTAALGNGLVNNTDYTFSVYVRNKDATKTQAVAWDLVETNRETEAGLIITWTSATEGSTIASVSDQIDTGSEPETGTSSASYTSVGGGWYRIVCSFRYETDHGTGIRLEIQPSADNADSENGAYIWGPQLVVGRKADASAGRAVPVVSATGTSVVVSGDYSSTPVWIGEQYQMLYRFSQHHLQSSASYRSRTPVVAGRLQLRHALLLYEDSAYFEVHVTPENEDAYVYTYSGNVLGSGAATAGEVGLESGEFKVGLYGRNDRLTVEIKNDTPLPSRLLAVEWVGDYSSTSRRF